jgi:flavin-dependent dehydrogenase
MNQPCHDLVVLGAGAAGATCAALAAQRGLSVAIIDPVDPRRPSAPHPEWITRPVLSILDELKLDASVFTTSPITGAVFHNADLDRTAETAEKEPPAFRIDYTTLTQTLAERAVGLGVRAQLGAAPLKVQVRERDVNVQFGNDDSVHGRFLVVASGSGRPPGASDAGERRWLAQFRGRLAKSKKDDRIHWALGRQGLAWWQTPDHLGVNLCERGERDDVAGLLQALLAEAREANVFPPVTDEVQSTIRPMPAVSALEMDSLVDKGTLRIGDAGGFVSFASMEGIYPTMWSAKLAVDVLAEAVRAPQPQDTLQDYDRRWRTAMAEYLRPPDIETPFLLPLVFSNRQMAARLAAAFWRGQRTE